MSSRPRDAFYLRFTSERVDRSDRGTSELRHICGSTNVRRQENMRRHLLALIAACAFGCAVLALPAGADPIQAKNASHIYGLCGTNAQRVDVVVNGNGTFT